VPTVFVACAGSRQAMLRIKTQGRICFMAGDKLAGFQFRSIVTRGIETGHH
jgi:hypothetical protein